MQEGIQSRAFVDSGELEKQRKYAMQAAEVLSSVHPHGYKAFVHVYGCQQNVSDGERMKGLLELMGFGFTDELEEADLVLFHTCAIREHAEDRVFGNVGALKHYKATHPNGMIVLSGCMTQQQRVAERIKHSYPYVDILFGTHAAHRLPEFVFRRLTAKKRVFDIVEDDRDISEGLPVHRDSRIRGWLPVMYGCNNFCTYCIVPYVRGRERSRRPEMIVSEAKELVSMGCRDITLLGQNVNSYGIGCGYGYDFADLIRAVNEIEGDFLIRFMTSHPKDCSIRLLDAMADCKKAAKHLHLPFQSGSDRILKAMNRRYDREKYLSLIRAARERMPDLSITSDVIVGFPGETYENFKETLSLVREVGFTSLFTFIYSPREGTPAAKLPDPVPHSEKVKWLQELTALQESIAAERNSALLNKTVRVLAESRDESTGLIEGRTEGNVTVEFDADDSVIGSFTDVRITEALNWILRGTPANNTDDK